MWCGKGGVYSSWWRCQMTIAGYCPMTTILPQWAAKLFPVDVCTRLCVWVVVVFILWSRLLGVSSISFLTGRRHRLIIQRRGTLLTHNRTLESTHSGFNLSQSTPHWWCSDEICKCLDMETFDSFCVGPDFLTLELACLCYQVHFRFDQSLSLFM